LVPVDPNTPESLIQPGVHIVGDAASAGDMPKSAFAANSQAKVCAFAIAAALTGSERLAPHLFNTCFTFLAADDAVSDAMSFKPTAGAIKINDIFISKVGENPETRRQAVRQADGWYAAFIHDLFG
jgi:NADH dehydrogenase FAD-containing subunit